MKKLFIAAVVIVSMSLQAVAGPILSISVEFGHGDGCADRGLCKITVSASKMTTTNINESTGNLDMHFNKSLMSPDILEYHFANNVFDVPVDYSLSADLCKQLGLSQFTVKAGKYKVIETNGILTVSFVNKTTLTTLTR